MTVLWDIVGWAGASTILAAFLAVSMGWMKAGSGFQTANLIGACAFIINGAVHEAWPSVATNVAWCLISAVALLRLRTARRKQGSDAATPVPEHSPSPAVTGPVAVVRTGPARNDSR